MGTNVYPGKAIIDPSAPETLGICDRCGSQWNLRDLQYQYQWMGPELQNTHLKVCPRCMDVPSEFLRTVILPPDPEPIYDGRPANFAIMERNEVTIKPIVGTRMFQGVASLFAQFSQIKGFPPFSFQDTAHWTAALEQIWQMIPEPVALLTEDGIELITEDGADYIGTENMGFGVSASFTVELTLTT